MTSDEIIFSTPTSKTSRGHEIKHWNDNPTIALYINDGLFQSKYKSHDRKINIFHGQLPKIGETVIPFSSGNNQKLHEYKVYNIIHHMHVNHSYQGNKVIEIYIKKIPWWKKIFRLL